MPIYIGVDGGGTKTQVLVMRGDQGASVIAPSSNPSSVGRDEAQHVILKAIDDCLRALSLTHTEVAGLSVCMAGVDRKNEMDAIRLVFEAQFPRAAVEITNDALAALTAGTKGEPGVVLIAGTGSIAIGESADGQVHRAGGYGYLLGDEGSGFAIGRAGLAAAIQSFESRLTPTKLWDRAAMAYDVTHPSQLIPTVYQAVHPVSTIARFAKEVVDLADADEVAKDIVTSAVSDYVRLIQAVVRLLEEFKSSGVHLDRAHLPGMAKPKVVLAGGLFTNTDVLVRRLRAASPEFELQPLRQSGAAGAVLRAIQVAHRGRNVAGLDLAGLPDIEASLARTRAQWNANVARWQHVNRPTSADELELYR